MVSQVRRSFAATALAVAGAIAVSAGAASAVTKHPAPKHSSRAVTRAEHSRGLWATINVCDTKRFPNTLGVRGQMPALGFPSSLFMSIQVTFFNKAKKRFVPAPGASMRIPLGSVSRGLQQGGATFTFRPHTGLLSARIKFVWERNGKVIGHTSRRTTAGHRGEDFGSPPHFSAKQCRI
jgi:hypothetical protein